MALLLLLALTISPLFTSPTISSSISPPPHPTTPHTGFRATLKHIDSGKNLTKSEILERAITRSNKRMQSLTDAIHLSSSGIDINAPLKPPRGPGEFLMKLAIGTPQLEMYATLDSGSDLLWTQCQPCKNCYHQTTPIYDPKKSSSYIELKCDGKPCVYKIDYGGGLAYTKGYLANETFTFGVNKVSVPKVAFGCGVDNTFVVDGAAGIVGLGPGPFSIVQQFQENRFAYCLTSYGSNKNGVLLMGSLARVNDKSLPIITTPLLKTEASTDHYFVSLEGITVGNTFLPINRNQVKEGGTDDPRNIVVDSGATFTYLEKSYFQKVSNAFVTQTGLPLGRGQYELCFIPSNGGSPKFPKLIFHFKGADDLVLPQENYVFKSKGLLCIAMVGNVVGGLQLFGNIQQQNTFVLHDLDKKTMSFVPTKSCDNV